MIELELKAVVVDPGACRERLAAARAVPGFRGLMEDRRFDRGGELLDSDRVLRVRRYRGPDRITIRVSWKGPARVVDGYKERAEIEFDAEPGGDSPEALFQALGYQIIEAIDRRVEYYSLGEAVVRLEWYPRMDVLVEVEGPPAAIERAVGVLAIDRATFTPEALSAFVTRFEARTGRRAAIRLADLTDERPSWETG